MTRYPELNRADLLAAIGDAREIYSSGCAAEIAVLPDLLGDALPDASVTNILSPLINRRSYASPVSGRRARTFFLNREVKLHMAAGVIELCSWSYQQIIHWLKNVVRTDVAIIMVSPPDAAGLVSIGVQSDFFPLFQHRIGKCIAVVNPQMPATRSQYRIALSEFDSVFSYDHPLLSPLVDDGEADPVVATIAGNVANLLPDGATIQLGLGKISQAVARALVDHRNLGVLSGLVDDNILHIEEKGVLDRSRPIMTGAAIGSPELYAALHDNPRFRFTTSEETHGLASLVNAPNYHSINSTLQVDLFGQINSEMVNGRLISTPGGFTDTLRGAYMNPTGRAIVTLRARGGAKTAPGIVAHLSSPTMVSSAKSDVDAVVSEFGVAELRNLSMDQRAHALIAIAAPEDRARLSNEWDAFHTENKTGPARVGTEVK